MKIKNYLSDQCLDRIQIQVDGGIKLHNAKEVISAGGDILVAGSEVFGSDDPQNVIKEFYDRANSVNA
jgi:ribulose-phosphate 3-epimerase